MFPRASCKKERTLRTVQTDRESRGLGGVRTLRPHFLFKPSNAIRLVSSVKRRAKLRRMASCIVSYLDSEGLRHTVEVEAASLYEAAVLAMRTFRDHECEPGLISQLEVEIRSSVIHTVTPKKVHEWLKGGARSPRDAILKERLRELIS